jgi:aspartyl-tRNA synthetase
VKPVRANAYRDRWGGDLRAADAGAEVRVAGWVHRRRDHGGLVFIDLRDRSGLVQLVFHPEETAAHEAAHALRPEHVVSAVGKVAAREERNVNPNMATGEIEIEVTALDAIASALTPPFPIDEDGPVDELIRLRHRPLDLRRAQMHDTLVLRHRITSAIRGYLDNNDFLDIETPMLTRSTPEGARDFLVPARNDPGSFYALPQSPQLFKQLLMIAGFERYFQIVRCFRDEETRADRQPEFTQLDMEMSFVEEDDVIAVVESMLTQVFAAVGFEGIAPAPWPRVTYAEAMARYGSDRPDRRYGLEIADLSEALGGAEFKVFSGAVASGGVVRAINAGAREVPRKDLDALTELAKQFGAKGLVWGFVEPDGSWRSPVAKFLTEDEISAIKSGLDASEGDLLLLVADDAKVAAAVLGVLRENLADRFGLREGKGHDLHWVIDFPMFAYDAEGDRWDAMHHPFTQPVGDLGDPGSLMSRGYDLVLDGNEIGGGSIRTSDPAVQRRVLELIGFSAQEAQERFGFLLDALDYGAPPHGGIAFGIDRIVGLLAGGRPSIRDTIAFPKTAAGGDPLTGAPAPVDERQLRELGLKVLAPREPPRA